LDDAISKRKGEAKGDKKEGFRKPSFKRFNRSDRFSKPFSKFPARKFGQDRPGRNFRERRDNRGFRDNKSRNDKFDKPLRQRRPISKVGLTRRFIRPTGRPSAQFNNRERERERPQTSQRSERPERPVPEKRRLRVSNLDFNITHKDLMELFSKLGSLTKNKIEYDDLGRSKGTALIEYEKHESAVNAMKEYDGAVLDGRTISVEFDDDVKKRSTESNIQRKVISKNHDFDRFRDRRSFDSDKEYYRKPFRRDQDRRPRFFKKNQF